MDTATVQNALKQLGGSLGDLEKNLQPLLTGALSDTTKKLPLLDRAKLYITIVYAIESLIFSYLRLQGVPAKDHEVFKELARVKQYFTKIKEAEEGPAKRQNLSLNKQAATRIVNNALSGNKKFDQELQDRKARELAIAKQKLQEMEERRRLKLLQKQSASDGQATPSAIESPAQTSEIDTSLVASAIAQAQDQAEAAETVLNSDPQTPGSLAASDLTDSSKTPRKSKKKRRLEQATEGSSTKKKRKHDNSGSAATS